MKTLKEVVLEFFKKDEISYQTPREDIFTCHFAANNGNYRVMIGTEEDDSYLVIYVISNLSISPEMRTKIAEYVTRANYAMRTGCFELDFDDGELRFRSAVVTQETELPLPILEKVFYASLSTLDRYLPGILKVLYNNSSPKAMVEELEG